MKPTKTILLGAALLFAGNALASAPKQAITSSYARQPHPRDFRRISLKPLKKPSIQWSASKATPRVSKDSMMYGGQNPFDVFDFFSARNSVRSNASPDVSRKRANLFRTVSAQVS